ncbi:HAD-IA family hydrolase [Gilvimarinus sp. F26214L]|uniref:HAD-IA family hydrolase n=1 Tax=Gilvimarinus sp. DZF01 TaxID=3461371 RepID=UPI0040468378
METSSRAIATYDAVLFDMDGVVTRTADLHAAAWKALFDDFLQHHAGENDSPRLFDIDSDYRNYVDGKPREAGLRSFLASRGIELPEGSPADPPEAETVAAMAKRKDELFSEQVEQRGVGLFPGTIDFIRALRSAGIRTGLVTSSRHGRELLKKAAIEELFDAALDGNDIADLDLRGKPDPAMFVECARRVGSSPARSVVVEDASSGIAAGEAGRFAFTLGVDRGGNREALVRHGADLVVGDLEELSPEELDAHVERRLDAHSWHIRQTGFDPVQERELESIFTVANGRLGVRGAPDTPLPNSQDDLFVAGIYGRKVEHVPYSETEFVTNGRDNPYAELVHFPSPFRLHLRIDDVPVELRESNWRSYRRTLALREAVVSNHVGFATPAGESSRLDTARVASLADPHLLLQEIEVCADNNSADLSVQVASRDPRWQEDHSNLSELHYSVEDGIEVQHYRVTGSDFEVCIALLMLEEGGCPMDTDLRLEMEIGRAVRLRRLVAVYSSRDCDHPREAALDRIKGESWASFDRALEDHRRAWDEVWNVSDIRIKGNPATEQALRFQLYHLNSAAAEASHISVGARALTGRAYEGHVFWDLEVFMFPFYLFTRPALARSLLSYRYTTLDGARRRAREFGFRGACYAWESTVDGSDETPKLILLKTTGKEIPIYTGKEQIHVTAAVAHAVWQYWEATVDESFMFEQGLEILAECARFWCSRVDREESFHIRAVTGPDEYHHTVNDNAYTNWMAHFNLRNALEGFAELERRDPAASGALRERIGVSDDEFELWREVADNLFLPRPNADGVIEQFEGFFELEDYPLPAHERFKAPVSRLFEAERINRLKLVKQADVLMLLHLFPDLFPRSVVAANYRYYEPITDHGSSLSPAVHAAIAARLGLREDAEHYWHQCLWLDLHNVMHNSVLGVHPAAMGGCWQALVFGFLGLRFERDGPATAPNQNRLPNHWRAVSMQINWRGRLYPVGVEP